MTSEKAFEYARDDFNYPRFIQKFLMRVLNLAIEKVEASKLDSKSFNMIRFGVAGLSLVAIIVWGYLATALLLGLYLFLDQIHLHIFVDRAIPANRFKHFIQEIPFILALAIHMWIEGHWWTGGAAIVGISGLYLITNLQMKYDLMAINIPHLYFLRWDRMGIIFLFSLLGAWPGERAYLFVVLLAWLLAALSFYDYIWIIIQLSKTKK